MLGRLLRRGMEERAQPFIVRSNDAWGVVGGSSAVDELANAAVWACIDVLASSVSGIPVDAVLMRGASRVPVEPTPPLISSPSHLATPDVWMYQVVQSMATDGNGFGLVAATDRLGLPTSIELVDPTLVTDRCVKDGVPQAKVNGSVTSIYPFGDLWHVPGKMVKPGSPFALNPLQHASKAVRAGLAAEGFGLQFFADGGHPTGIIYSDIEVDGEQAKDIKRSFKRAMSGAREPAVLGAGLKYEKVSVDPNDSQFLELQRWTVEQVCRFFRVPPAMVYASVSGQNITYANVSQADLHYLKHSLDGYLVRLEGALSALLPDGQVVKFNRSALLRSDAEGRNKVYDMRLRNRTMSVNEARALEDEPPVNDPAFDLPGIPGGAAPATEPKPEEGA